MGLWQCTANTRELFSSFEMILNESTLIKINNKIEKPMSNEDKYNYNFIYSLINYYQSLKNISYIKRKYTFYVVSSKMKNISSFHTLKKSREIFISWIKLLYKTPKNDTFTLSNKENEIQFIKSEIIKNIKQNKLLNIFIENFNKYYNNINNKVFIKLILSGLPDFLRPIIWLIILEKNTKIANRPSLKECLNQSQNNQNIKQICRDINRTFIISNEDNMSTIEKVDDEKINKLKNVLIAVSNYYSEIGYTQGMNNIVGFLLKITKFDEEKTFDLAILILEKIKGYFIKDFPLLKENLNKFNKEFKRRNNKLYKHFQKNETPDELWISKWIQTLFTISFPYNEVCRIWDSLLVFGFDFIIYLSLAIVYFAEDKLLELDDSSDLSNCLKEIMNPNPGVKKYINKDSNYKDYVIPIYSLISRAKKIKRENLFDSNSNNFGNRRNNSDYYDYNENINYDNQYNKQTSLKSGSMSFSSYDFNNQHNISNCDLKSSSSVKNISKNNNPILKCLNQSNDLKSNNSLLNNNVEINNKQINLRKNSDFSENSINLNIIPKKMSADLNDYKTNDRSKVSNIKSKFYNNCFKNISNPTYYNNNNNYCFYEIYSNNLNTNNRNFVNGRPRRNMKILIHKKCANLNVPLDNNQIINKITTTKKNFISKSPQYIRFKPKYNLYVNVNINNNIRYGQIQNPIIPTNNNFIINSQRRGSYNIPVPVNYYFGYHNVVKKFE